MESLLGIIYALTAMIGFGVGGAISPIAIRKTGAMASVFWRNLFTSIMFFLLLLVVPFRYEYSLKYISIALLISFIGFIPSWTFY